MGPYGPAVQLSNGILCSGRCGPQAQAQVSVLVVRVTLAPTCFTYPTCHRLGLSQCIRPSEWQTLRQRPACRMFMGDQPPWMGGGRYGQKEKSSCNEAPLSPLAQPTGSYNGSLELDQRDQACGPPVWITHGMWATLERV